MLHPAHSPTPAHARLRRRPPGRRPGRRPPRARSSPSVPISGRGAAPTLDRPAGRHRHHRPRGRAAAPGTPWSSREKAPAPTGPGAARAAAPGGRPSQSTQDDPRRDQLRPWARRAHAGALLEDAVGQGAAGGADHVGERHAEPRRTARLEVLVTGRCRGRQQVEPLLRLAASPEARGDRPGVPDGPGAGNVPPATVGGSSTRPPRRSATA